MLQMQVTYPQESQMEYTHHHFLWFTWATIAHRDCAHPTEIHKHVVRLKGEVPLPFDQVAKLSDSELAYIFQEEKRIGPA